MEEEAMLRAVCSTSWLVVRNSELDNVDGIIEQARASGFSRPFDGVEKYYIEFADQQPFLAGGYTEEELRAECSRLHGEQLRLAS
jgi:hypothetical protein